MIERISAFMDGETSRREARKAISLLQQNDDDCVNWKAFHLIGDVMRGDRMLQDDFLTRFHDVMEQEPTLIPPRLAWRKTANFTLSAAASVAAVAVIFTLVMSEQNFMSPREVAMAPTTGAPSAIPSAATVTDPLVTADQSAFQTASSAPQPVAAEQRLKVNEYLMAHQEFSPSSTLQGVAPYVRTVSAAPDRNR